MLTIKYDAADWGPATLVGCAETACHLKWTSAELEIFAPLSHVNSINPLVVAEARFECPFMVGEPPLIRECITGRFPPIADPRASWFDAAMSHEIYRLIRLLEDSKVHFELSRHRPDSIMITATLVGERIEIDVFEDGHVEYSRFRGNEDVEDDVALLEALLRDDGQG